jgi:hypothetical protein
MIFRSLLVALSLFLAMPQASAVAQTARDANTASTQVPAGTTVRDSDGREVNVGQDGRATVKHEGKLKNHPTEPGVKVCDKIVGVSVGTGGCKNLTVKGTMTVDIDKRGVTVTSNGGAGNPPSTDGAVINVTGDDVTVNANGTNTTVNQQSGSSGTTVNAGPGSSGSITYRPARAIRARSTTARALATGR